MYKRARLLAAVVAAASLSLACSSTPTSPQTVWVTIDYISTVNPTLPFDIGCARAVIRTHIRASWLDFALVDPVEVSEGHWTMVFSGVPVDTEVQVLVLDIDACMDASSLNGSVTEIVRANGVQLTRVVSLPFAGVANGLAFRVMADGTVIP